MKKEIIFYMVETSRYINAETVVDSPVYEKAFDVEYMPNVTIEGVYFNGNTYIKANQLLCHALIMKKIEYP
jgi:hypothetical protein